MKVLHVLYSARAEGTVKLALDWLGEPGHLHEVLVLNPNTPDMAVDLRLKASWYAQPDVAPSGWRKFPWIVSFVRRACRERRPDLLVCWPNGFSPWVLAGARLAGVRRLVTHAGNPPNWGLKGKVQTVVSTCVAWVSGGRMVCCSQYVASQFARSPGVFSSVLRTVPNCAPVEKIREEARRARGAPTERRRRFIMVATLEAHKDHATLLRAMPHVLQKVPSAQLWLAGDGLLRAGLRDQCAALGISKSVAFLGSRTDVPDLLGRSDVFVFSTTLQEGLGTVLVEALAAGLPIVASDVPACRELLCGGEWGTLVPASDPEALAAAMVASLDVAVPSNSPERQAYLARFAPSRMIEAYIDAAS
jgi:glycosyltransferase involved in cell wall biosynthesis